MSDVSEELEASKRRAWLRVLKGFRRGDTLGPPFPSHSGASMARRFIRSGEAHPVSLIEEMERHGLVAIRPQEDEARGEEGDEQEGRVSITAEGRAFLKRHGP